MAVGPQTLTVVESLLGVTVCVIGVVFALLELDRGVWLDEFITLAWTSQGRSVRDFMSLLITREFHPILHFGLIYLAQNFGLTDIAVLRSLNFSGMVLVVCVTAYAYRFKSISSSQAVIILALFTSSTIFHGYFAELRAYFLLYSASIAVCLLWYMLMRCIESGSSPPKSMIAIWGLCLAIFVNLHYFATILGGILTITLLFRLGIRRSFELMFVVASVSMMAASPAIILGAIQMHNHGTTGTGSWIQTDVRESIVHIVHMVGAAAAWNPVAAASAITVGLFVLENGKKWREVRKVVILLAVTASFLGGLVVLNAVTPCIIYRYLFAAGGAVTVAIGLLAASAGTPRWVPTMVCVLALLVQAQAFGRSEQALSWDASAKAVAQLKAQCPTTRILAYVRWQMNDLSLALQLNKVSYGHYAKKLQFSYEDLLPGTTIAAAGSCPTVVWIEHPPRSATLDSILSELQIHGDVQLKRYGGLGVVLIVRPKPDSAHD
jgi:hypothetical protein